MPVILFFYKGCMDKSRRYASGGSNGEVCGRTKKGQTHVPGIKFFIIILTFFLEINQFKFLALLWKKESLIRGYTEVHSENYW